MVMKCGHPEQYLKVSPSGAKYCLICKSRKGQRQRHAEKMRAENSETFKRKQAAKEAWVRRKKLAKEG